LTDFIAELEKLGVSNLEFNDSRTELTIFNGESKTNCKFNEKKSAQSFEALEEQMNTSGYFGDQKVVRQIVKLISDMHAENRKENQQQQQSNGNKKKKHEILTYKYSNKGKDSIHEAVILSGKPTFLKYDSNAAEPITSVESIEEDTRIIVPPHVENYPYDPYEFDNMNDVLSYLERAKEETIDSLYKQSKQIAEDYNDQNEYKVKLLATNIIWVYFQDKFPTTHYDIVLGSPGSGKSSYGETFAAVGYRVVNLTDPNAANINRILGTVEPGQCTIVSDETGEINKHHDLMAILKTGYSKKGKTSKINDYSRMPEFYSTYCYKMIIAEKMPNLKDAKGVIDRSFSYTAFKGKPRYDIKETLEHQGNPARIERLDTLNDFRKLMLVYRLLHFKDVIDDVDVGVEGREKELAKPIIQLFYGTDTQQEIEKTLQYFLNQRNEKKDTMLEPVLHPIVTALISKNQTNGIYVKDIWEIIVNDLGGRYDEKKPNEFQSEDYGTIYRNQIGTILEHTFGGTPRHNRKGNSYNFDLNELVRVGKAYNLTTNIQTKIVLEDLCEGVKAVKVPIEAPQSKIEDSGNLLGKSSLKEADNRGSNSIEPSPSSQPSQASASDIPTTSEFPPVHSDYHWSDKTGLWYCNVCGLGGDKSEMENGYCSQRKRKGKN
jgi:hypothetical protein